MYRKCLANIPITLVYFKHEQRSCSTKAAKIHHNHDIYIPSNNHIYTTVSALAAYIFYLRVIKMNERNMTKAEVIDKIIDVLIQLGRVASPAEYESADPELKAAPARTSAQKQPSILL